MRDVGKAEYHLPGIVVIIISYDRLIDSIRSQQNGHWPGDYYRGCPFMGQKQVHSVGNLPRPPFVDLCNLFCNYRSAAPHWKSYSLRNIVDCPGSPPYCRFSCHGTLLYPVNKRKKNNGPVQSISIPSAPLSWILLAQEIIAQSQEGIPEPDVPLTVDHE